MRHGRGSTQRLTELEAQRAELAAADDGLEPLTDDDLHALQAHLATVIAEGDPPARKALLRALVQEVRVVSHEIYPFFNLPVVRPPCGSVPPVGDAMPATASPVADGEQDCEEEDQPDAGSEAEARQDKWMTLVV